MPRRTIAVRNPVARSPLLRKGGAHAESKTGQRVQARLATNSAVDEWLDEREDGEQCQEDGGGADAAPSPFPAPSPVLILTHFFATSLT